MDAEALIAASDASAGQAVMGLHMRWHRLVQRARSAIRNGEIGDLESVRIVWNSPRSDVNIPNWKRSRTTGGGALVELGVHVFDLWRFLADSEVLDVFARARHGTRDDECALVTATLENGVLASASLSERSSHHLEIDIAGNQGRLRVDCQRFDGFELYGRDETDGMLKPRARHLARAARELPGGLARMRQLGDYGDSYRGEWQHVLDVAAGARPACTLDDGMKALQVVLAAVAAARQKQPVRVERAPRTIADVEKDG